MDLIPDEELKPKALINLTPMVDFLFLVIAIFSILAITRTTLFDSEVKLAKIAEQDALYPAVEDSDSPMVTLSITEKGNYKWVTEFNEYSMENPSAILLELSTQERLGLLPKDSSKTKIFLHVDKKAEWDPIVQLIYSLKKKGYSVHPVYEKNPL